MFLYKLLGNFFLQTFGSATNTLADESKENEQHLNNVQCDLGVCPGGMCQDKLGHVCAPQALTVDALVSMCVFLTC